MGYFRKKDHNRGWYRHCRRHSNVGTRSMSNQGAHLYNQKGNPLSPGFPGWELRDNSSCLQFPPLSERTVAVARPV